MTRSKHYIIIICSLTFTVFIALVFCAVSLDMMGNHKDNFEEEFKAEINVVLPEKIYVANEAVVEWMNGTDTAKNVYNKSIIRTIFGSIPRFERYAC